MVLPTISQEEINKAQEEKAAQDTFFLSRHVIDRLRAAAFSDEDPLKFSITTVPRHRNDPGTVPPDWNEFFGQLRSRGFVPTETKEWSRGSGSRGFEFGVRNPFRHREGTEDPDPCGETYPKHFTRSSLYREDEHSRTAARDRIEKAIDSEYGKRGQASVRISGPYECEAANHWANHYNNNGYSARADCGPAGGNFFLRKQVG